MPLKRQNQLYLTLKPQLVEVIYERKFLIVRLLILFSCLMSFVTTIFTKTVFFSQLFIVQFVILPLISTYLILKWIEISNNKERYKAGAIIGAIVGGFPSTIFVLINLIAYFIFGGIEKASLIFEVSASPISLKGLLLFGLINNLGNWVILILVGSSVGLITALFLNVKKWQGY